MIHFNWIFEVYFSLCRLAFHVTTCLCACWELIEFASVSQQRQNWQQIKDKCIQYVGQCNAIAAFCSYLLPLYPHPSDWFVLVHALETPDMKLKTNTGMNAFKQKWNETSLQNNLHSRVISAMQFWPWSTACSQRKITQVIVSTQLFKQPNASTFSSMRTIK